MIALTLAALLSVWSPDVAIQAYVEEAYPWPKIEVHGSAQQTLPDTPPESISLINGSIPGNVTFVLRFPDGHAYEYEATVEAYDWVINNVRALRKGDVVGQDDVYRTLINIRKIPPGAITEQSNVSGKTLTHTVAANETLTMDSLKDPFTVKKGQEVVIVYETQNVRFTGKGIAKQDGRTGDTIRITNPSSKRVITGRITDEKTITVEN